MKESRIGHTHLYLTIILDSSTNFVLVHIFCWKAGEGGGYGGSSELVGWTF